MVASGWGPGERIEYTEAQGNVRNDGNVLNIDCAGGVIDVKSAKVPKPTKLYT